MANYCVAHVQKFTGGSVGAMEKHLEHKAKNSKNKDIDPERTHLNENILDDGSGRSLREKIKAVADTRQNPEKKIRKDAIQFCSVMVSASPDFFKGKTKDQCMEYFNAASEFLQEKYGKENCVGAYVHFDEKTPHMHFVFVPMTKDRRLSSKEVNSRGQLTSLQNELPKHLQRNGFNVRRGEINSPQQHVDTADWKRDENVLNKTRAALVKIVNPKHEKEKRLGFFGDTGNVILSQGDFEKLQKLAAQSVHLMENRAEKKREEKNVTDFYFKLQQRQMELDEREKQLDSRDGQLLLQKAKEYVEKIPDLPEVKMKLDRLATEQLKKENPERYKQLRGYYAKKVRTETLDLQKERQGKGVKRS